MCPQCHVHEHPTGVRHAAIRLREQPFKKRVATWHVASHDSPACNALRLSALGPGVPAQPGASQSLGVGHLRESLFRVSVVVYN